MRHGYSVGCPGCEQFQFKSQTCRNHTEECRERIGIELSKTFDDQDRLNRVKYRLDTRVAEIGKAEIDRENIEKEINLEPQQENINEDINESNNDLEGAGGVEPMAQGTPNPSTPREGPVAEHFDLSPRASIPKRRGDEDDMDDDSPDKILRREQFNIKEKLQIGV